MIMISGLILTILALMLVSWIALRQSLSHYTECQALTPELSLLTNKERVLRYQEPIIAKFAHLIRQDERESGSLTQQISYLADSLKILITSLPVAAPSTEDHRSKEVLYYLELESDFHSLLSFINRVERMRNFLGVRFSHLTNERKGKHGAGQPNTLELKLLLMFVKNN